MTSDARPVRPGDVVITGLLLLLFASGWVAAASWPYRAALFPRIVTATGAALCLVKLAQLAYRAVHGRASHPEPAGATGASGLRIVDEDEEDEQALEYIFATAGARAWAAALGWIAAFYVGLRLFGLFWTVPVFTVAYLWVSGRTSLRAALVYGLVTDAVLYLAFVELLQLPYPRGLI